ncbi:DUF983 domain-containing protein [Flavobacterium sp. UMI-01]|uniref:DUF983 domain-containing protein n=1 Tax=Flavobacterium sp. UMI-01 TaxID=1441053 RepID=UPI001C7DF995|nr:DUF983 domain-containing protein [Flavobacterium sp. UMI-01]
MIDTLYHLFKNKCPNCHKGSVFNEKKPFLKLGFPTMHSHCSHCHFKFEKEPGYFFGAMYMNYGLTVAQSIATYGIAQIFFKETFDIRIIPIIAVVIVVMASFNIRFSRLLWIYLFKGYSA